MKLGPDCFSEWGAIPAGVLQGTELGPWLFIVIINELDIPDNKLWKYVDDTTILETVGENRPSTIQTAVDTFVTRAAEDKFQLNEAKCKELRITFSTTNNCFYPIVINGSEIECVPKAKILGMLLHVTVNGIVILMRSERNLGNGCIACHSSNALVSAHRS